MVVYDRLWETMKKKGLSQYRLIKYYGFSSGQIGRLKKNMYVSTHTIDVLCNLLKCSVEEVMEVRQDMNQELQVKSPAAMDSNSLKEKRKTNK